MEVVELFKIDPSQNVRRFYAISLCADLFGTDGVMRAWGRIGTPGRVRFDPYPADAQARIALEKLRRRKIGRGYQERLP